ncbi:MAG TPA: nuclear transport factor 2 family protein, partial [Thermoleophilaceae bacterium]|nr:nuclear transport factor 2 family protein [Thermoleophilaceae bacterium]
HLALVPHARRGTRGGRDLMDPALEERIRRGYAAYVEGDLDAALESFAPGVELVNPDYALDGGVREGLADMRESLADLLKQFEFDAIDIEEIVDGPGVVVVMVNIQARGRQSGVPMDQRFAHVWRFRGDQTVSYQWFFTREEALAAAGL